MVISNSSCKDWYPHPLPQTQKAPWSRQGLSAAASITGHNGFCPEVPKPVGTVQPHRMLEKLSILFPSLDLSKCPYDSSIQSEGGFVAWIRYSTQVHYGSCQVKASVKASSATSILLRLHLDSGTHNRNLWCWACGLHLGSLCCPEWVPCLHPSHFQVKCLFSTTNPRWLVVSWLFSFASPSCVYHNGPNPFHPRRVGSA